ncbi:hypothetical protein N7507_003067 [Penicillium longicatenatum]|nr:hypothetical protein N7507_003067 [Penicillium longicatenatum]
MVRSKMHASYWDVVEEPEYEGDEQGVSFSPQSSLSYTYLFPSVSVADNLLSLHPPYPRRLHAWQLFKEYVHPMATILHISSIESQILSAMASPQAASSRGWEALMFAVYYGAATSLSADDCLEDFEMRRRLWWNLCILDTPASEDHSCNPAILEMSNFDASPPQNLNDSDMTPEMIDYPPETDLMTEISFTIARVCLSRLWRIMVDTRRPTSTGGDSFASMTMMEKEAWMTQEQHTLERRFIHSISTSDPLHWVSSLP